MMYTHVMNRRGSRGVKSPADRLEELRKQASAETLRRTESVRAEPDMAQEVARQPVREQEDELRSTRNGLRDYWTKLVRLFGISSDHD